MIKPILYVFLFFIAVCWGNTNSSNFANAKISELESSAAKNLDKSYDP